VREDGGDGEAAGALDVHEEGAGGGHESLRKDELDDFEEFPGRLLCLSYLELVLLSLGRGGRVQKVDGENLDRTSSAFGRKSSISTAENDPNLRQSAPGLDCHQYTDASATHRYLQHHPPSGRDIGRDFSSRSKL
jgi:hypothetical protein